MVINVADLKARFLTGDFPSGLDFADLIDTLVAGPQGEITIANLAPIAGNSYWTTNSEGAWQVSALPTALPPNGSAGGGLSGTYPNPGIGTGVVGTAQLNPAGASAGYTFIYSGSAWVLRLPYPTRAVVTGTPIPAAGSMATIPHTLGAQPFNFAVTMVMGASTELGYSNLEELEVEGIQACSDDGNYTYPKDYFTITADATNVYVTVSQDTFYAGFISTKNTGVAAAFTPAKWTLTVRATL